MGQLWDNYGTTMGQPMGQPMGQLKNPRGLTTSGVRTRTYTGLLVLSIDLDQNSTETKGN